MLLWVCLLVSGNVQFWGSSGSPGSKCTSLNCFSRCPSGEGADGRASGVYEYSLSRMAREGPVIVSIGLCC